MWVLLFRTMSAFRRGETATRDKAVPVPARAGMGHRIAVVTPFLDKHHGTERCVAEQVDRLARDHGYEVHIYSERVEDVAVSKAASRDDEVSGQIVWHRVPGIPGPYLIRYLWWFGTNHLIRLIGWCRGMRYDLVYSPGINCLDADVIAVHIVFREFYEGVATELRLLANRLRTWPRVVHRLAFYHLIMRLERLIYGKGGPALVAVSRKTTADLARWYPGGSTALVIYNVVDERFDPEVRLRLRAEARKALGLADTVFALLLIGNDWINKGLSTLLEAATRLGALQLRLLIAGRDDRALFDEAVERAGLRDRVMYLPIRRDVEFYYAAADCYVAPSRGDAFGLPPAEAMACGLPAIVSSRNGGSEIVTDGVDGLILKNPRDAEELAELIRRVYENADLRRRLGESAARTTRAYTWARNAAELNAIFEDVIRQKAAR